MRTKCAAIVLMLVFLAFAFSGCGKGTATIAAWFGAMDKPQWRSGIRTPKEEAGTKKARMFRAFLVRGGRKSSLRTADAERFDDRGETVALNVLAKRLPAFDLGFNLIVEDAYLF